MGDELPIVFVVDDDAAVREALESLLRSATLRVQSFSSAQAFLSYRRPEALLLDEFGGTSSLTSCVPIP